MLRAALSDKKHVVELLTDAFIDNPSVNSIVKKDGGKRGRIKKVFEFYFDLSVQDGGLIYLSKDRLACAVVSLPGKKKSGFRSFMLDLRLLFILGLNSTLKAMEREKQIRAVRPDIPFYYLKFLAVDPKVQGKGIGTKLLKELIAESRRLKLPLYLETSVKGNVPFYQKQGFRLYRETSTGFPMYYLSRDL